MTGRKLRRTEAARRLGKTLDEVEALIANGTLRLESIAGDHEVIPEADVDRLAEHADKPTFRGGPALDVTAEDEYRREQGT